MQFSSTNCTSRYQNKSLALESYLPKNEGLMSCVTLGYGVLGVLGN